MRRPTWIASWRLRLSSQAYLTWIASIRANTRARVKPAELTGEHAAAQAFTALALFNQLRFPLAFLPFLLTSVLSFLVGMKRVQDFLCADEVKEGGNVAQLTDEPQGTVRIVGGEFCWDLDEDPSLEALKDKPEEASPEEASPEEVKMHRGPTLSDIELTLKPGSLNLVVGPVGSGKSSLLATLTDDINVTAGTVGMAGKVAYVAQSAFVLNDTLQNNVLFSLPMDRKRYQQVRLLPASAHPPVPTGARVHCVQTLHMQTPTPATSVGHV